MIRRIFWISVNTVIELYRDRAVTGFLFVGLLLIFAGQVVADLSVVERKKMYIDVGMGAIFLVGIFITLLGGSNVVDREVRERQVLCTLSKPVPRSAWLVGKTFGFLFTVGAVIAIMTTFLFVYVRFRVGFWMPVLFLGGFLIFLEMLVLSSYTILFSTITSQYLALFLSLMVLVIGHMVDDLKLYWASASFVVRAAARVLFFVMPDLESFLASPVVMSYIKVPPNLLISITLYSVAYLAACITIATLVMNRKEIA
ncbi:MAG TPA: hypothetical protein PLQ76_07750 [bacterium]|nr:hypothetical protein [bacterium]